jgi:hypothetical protein
MGYIIVHLDVIVYYMGTSVGIYFSKPAEDPSGVGEIPVYG